MNNNYTTKFLEVSFGTLRLRELPMMEQRPGLALQALFAGRIPLWVKLLATLWVAVLIPEQGTWLNLLWFCKVALVLTTVGLWFESSFLVSMQAVGSAWWMLLWVLDFLIHLAAGINTTPAPLGQTNYMFDGRMSPFGQGLSMYHIWLPFVLLLALRRLGYDRRAVFAQTLQGWVLLLLSYGLTTGIHGPGGNLNGVYVEGQQWVSPEVWLVLVMLYCAMAWYLPTHLIFRRLFLPSGGGGSDHTIARGYAGLAGGIALAVVGLFVLWWTAQ